MLSPAAEQTFRKGKEALESDRWVEAQALFEAAIELDRRHGAEKIQARYLSYYGLCLTRDRKRAREGVEACRQATHRESFNPELYWNLARALLAARRRREAHRALRIGLGLDPGHRGIRHDLRMMGFRRRPLLPFLRRSHPLNVFLGKLQPR